MREDERWLVYFYMRKTQLDHVQNMMQLISQVYEQLPQCLLVAKLFDQLSRDVKEPHYTGKTEQLLLELEELFRAMDLPATRQEFEVRSAVLQLNRELYSFLKIAKRTNKKTTGRLNWPAGGMRTVSSIIKIYYV